ncbi:hypothetical protein CRUP_006663, partial [Coryphaenoides rupestris]
CLPGFAPQGGARQGVAGGAYLPRLAELKLNDSTVASVRCLPGFAPQGGARQGVAGGAYLPRLAELKLNDSTVASVRDLGSTLAHLRVLWLSRCCLTDLDGIIPFTDLKELYVAYNSVSDLSQLSMLEGLQVLDAEGNDVDDLRQVQHLALCSQLHTLSLEGNPVCVRPHPTATSQNDDITLLQIDDITLLQTDDITHLQTDDITHLQSQPQTQARRVLNSDTYRTDEELRQSLAWSGCVLFCGNPVQALRARRAKLRTAPPTPRAPSPPPCGPLYVPEHTYDDDDDEEEEPGGQGELGDVLADLRAWRGQHAKRLQLIEQERRAEVLKVDHTEEDDEDDEDDDDEDLGVAKTDESSEEECEEEEERRSRRGQKPASPDSSFASISPGAPPPLLSPGAPPPLLSPDEPQRDSLSSPDVTPLLTPLPPPSPPSPPPMDASLVATATRSSRPSGVRTRRLRLLPALSGGTPGGVSGDIRHPARTEPGLGVPRCRAPEEASSQSKSFPAVQRRDGRIDDTTTSPRRPGPPAPDPPTPGPAAGHEDQASHCERRAAETPPAMHTAGQQGELSPRLSPGGSQHIEGRIPNATPASQPASQPADGRLTRHQQRDCYSSPSSISSRLFITREDKSVLLCGGGGGGGAAAAAVLQERALDPGPRVADWSGPADSLWERRQRLPGGL